VMAVKEAATRFAGAHDAVAHAAAARALRHLPPRGGRPWGGGKRSGEGVER